MGSYGRPDTACQQQFRQPTAKLQTVQWDGLRAWLVAPPFPNKHGDTAIVPLLQEDIQIQVRPSLCNVFETFHGKLF